MEQYNKKTMEKAVLALLVISLASSAAADISLGSITDVKYLTLDKEDIGEFKASFFNMGDEAIDLELQLDYPSELRAEIYPKKLTLHPGATDVSSCQDCEFFILADGISYVRTYPVYVYVKIPEQVSRNLYEIKLTVIARNNGDSGDSGIKQSLAQVREIAFTARVRGSATGNSEDESEDSKTSNTSTGEQWWKTALNVSDASSGGSGSESGQGSSQGSGAGSGETTTTTKPAASKPSTQTSGGGQLIETDAQGNTKINLPIGDVILSKEESEATIDIGIVTLGISVISLLVKILKT